MRICLFEQHSVLQLIEDIKELYLVVQDAKYFVFFRCETDGFDVDEIGQDFYLIGEGLVAEGQPLLALLYLSFFYLEANGLDV